MIAQRRLPLPPPSRRLFSLFARLRHQLHHQLGRVLLLGFVMALSGCATLAPRSFDSEDAVLRQLGQPTRVWDNPDGTRTLEYATQPYGETCWMYTVDSGGVMLEQFDALAPDRLGRVKNGMSAEDVLRLLGQQRSIQHFPNSGEDVWDWNIRNDWPDLRATRFNVHFIDGQVVRTSRSFEYRDEGWMRFGASRGVGPYWGWGWGWGRPHPWYGGYPWWY